MSAQITIGHPSLSAFKPYFRSADQQQQFEPNVAQNTTTSSAESENGTSSDDVPQQSTTARRRQRTTFTPTQAETLEKEYLSDQYMPRSRRIFIAKTLGLNEGQVKTWFQNRRAKDKRNDKSSGTQRLAVGVSPGSSPDLCTNSALIYQQLCAKNYASLQLSMR